MRANTTYDRAKAVADEIAELPHVTGVTFDDSTAHFVSSAALLTVSFDGDETERFPTDSRPSMTRSSRRLQSPS